MYDFLGNSVKVGDTVDVPCKIIETTESDTCNVRLQPVNQPDENRTEDFWTIAGCCFKDIKEGITFGLAIEAMKQGLKVLRTGWKGKGMWIEYVPGDGWARLFGNTTDYTNNPFIAMKTADDKFVPWLASQTDILAEDWIILE